MDILKKFIIEQELDDVLNDVKNDIGGGEDKKEDTETTDDIYANSNTTSITNYGLRNPFTWHPDKRAVFRAACSWQSRIAPSLKRAIQQIAWPGHVAREDVFWG